MDNIGSYDEKPFPKLRDFVIESSEQGQKRHLIHGFIEVDVTNTRDLLRKYKAKTFESLSFTGWVIKCVAQAIKDHKEVHAMRKGRKKVIAFNDVDVSIMVERTVDGNLFPTVIIIRKANEKSFMDIHTEIRNAQTFKDEQVIEHHNQKRVKLLIKVPKFLRNLLFWRKIRKNPFFVKRNMGTIVVTAVGLFGKYTGWGLGPGSVYPLSVIVGGISKKPGVIDDKIAIREYLHLTISANHDVVDGAPLARFISRLSSLMEDAFSLDQIT